MRTCPNCQREYGDDINFCLQDGTRLRQDEYTTVPFTLGDVGETVTEEAVLPRTEPAVSEPTVNSVYEPSASAPTLAPAYEAEPTRRSGLLIFLFSLLFLGGLFVVLAIVGYRQFLRVETAAEPIAANTSVANSPGTLPNTLEPSGSASGSAVPSPNLSSNANQTSGSASPTPRPTATKQQVEVNSARPSTDADEPSVAQQPAKPKTLSGGVLNGKAISLPKPPYPPAARAVRASGAVTVQVLIDEDGNVVSATAISGHPLLQAAAVAAARGAKFTPTKLSGQPVKVSGVITYNFTP